MAVVPVEDLSRELLAMAQAEASPDGLLVVSPEGRMVFWNRSFADIWGLPAAVMTAADADAALVVAMERVADPEGFRKRVEEIYASPAGRFQDEIELRDGRILDRFSAPLHDRGGTHLGWAWYFRDVTYHRRTERDLRELAETLQATLLPPRPPQIPGMEVATHYVPADRQVAVGGDFFDVFRLAPNEWGLAIGDVCGKGAKAATLTALSRYTLRAAAGHSRLPSAVLDELNGVIRAEPEGDDRFCSVAFATIELDECGAWVTLACGGHPRPIVLRRAGWLDVRGQAGLLLGMFEQLDVTDDRVGLGPGDALVFCTDGITEARNAAGEMFGEEALPGVLLAHTGSTARTITDKVVEAALGFSAGHRHDDVALVVVRVPDDAGVDPRRRLAEAVGVAPEELAGRRLTRHTVGDEYAGLRHLRPGPPREARIHLPPDLRSAGGARRFLAGVLHSWRMSELVDGDLELLASEVASNAVRHAGSDFTVVVHYDGRVIRVEVGDGSRVLPVAQAPPADSPDGRGLRLVELLAQSWGVVPTVEGKRVWFEVPAPPPPTPGG